MTVDHRMAAGHQRADEGHGGAAEGRHPLVPAIRLGRRSSVLLAVTTAFGLVAFGWPLLIHAHSSVNNAHSGDAPWIFVALVPLLLGIVMAELSEGAIDAKAVALLGIMAACFAALRVPSPGINGFEPEWFLLILSARVFGRGFGFVLGAVAFFASALATGGVGPWLPFQMIAAAWVGFGAGCLPPLRGAPERVALAAYGAVAALLYGLVMNFWFWPFGAGTTTQYSFVPGAGVLTNLHSFLLFDLTTSMGFDLTRAATTAVLILVLGRPVLAALRRTSRRAVFEPVVEFSDSETGSTQSA
jgi:energy-coupling factor transport system substrate-specific component